VPVIVSEAYVPKKASPPAKVARAAAWPLRRFFWPQFEWVRSQIINTDHRIHGKIDQATAEIDARVDSVDSRLVRMMEGLGVSVTDATETSAEALAQAGQELRSTSDWLAAVQEQLTVLSGDLGALRGDISELRLTGDWLASLQSELDRLTVGREELSALRDLIRQNPLRRLVDADVADIDNGLADLLNYSESHRGFRGQSRLWFNHPVQVAYVPGGVLPVGVNERIVEVPYVFRALAGTPARARVLDVGSAESTVSLSLAALGYEVTSLDLREYPLEHPSLEAIASPLDEWDAEEASYDAIICLSSIEHFGVGAYGEASGEGGSDRAAIEKLLTLAKPGALLILTVPFGRARRTDTERVYDRGTLDALLGGWDISDLTIVRQTEPLVWEVVPEDTGFVGDDDGVAMVVGRAPTG